MRKLEDLKKDILNNKIDKFYVFYGEDYGIRKHYIDKIATYFQRRRKLKSCEALADTTVTKSLFQIKELITIHSDLDFPKQRKDYIQSFINRLDENRAVILIYEEPLDNSTLWKEFSDYITYFPTVQDNVAIEFVDSELNLLDQDKEEFIFDCKNNYNNILLESNKVKNYAQAKSLSEQNSYEALFNKGQMLQEYESFNVNMFMNDILNGNFNNVAYWTNIIKTKDVDRFYVTLTSIFFDYLIAFLIKKYGRYDGSSRAYDYKLPWGRAKTIREFDIPYDADYLLECAYKVAQIDVEVKTGKLLREDCIDYFISLIV